MGFQVLETSKLLNYARARSLWIVTFCTGCGGVELPPTATARFDFERFGIISTPSIRQADLLLITGYVTPKTLKRIIIVYEMMRNPKYIIAHGSCPVNAGIYWDSYNTVKKLDLYIPVDVWIAGCMPRPEAILRALVKLMKMVKEGKALGWKRYLENFEFYRKNQDRLFGKDWRKREIEKLRFYIHD